MWDKADLHPGEDILCTDVGGGVNENNVSRCELYRLFQAQVLHPILDVHILSQIVNRLGDKLRQPMSTLEDGLTFIICTRAVVLGHPRQCLAWSKGFRHRMRLETQSPVDRPTTRFV
jgi:hypothetical protein